MIAKTSNNNNDNNSHSRAHLRRRTNDHQANWLLAHTKHATAPLTAITTTTTTPFPAQQTDALTVTAKLHRGMPPTVAHTAAADITATLLITARPAPAYCSSNATFHRVRHRSTLPSITWRGVCASCVAESGPGACAGRRRGRPSRLLAWNLGLYRQHCRHMDSSGGLGGAPLEMGGVCCGLRNISGSYRLSLALFVHTCGLDLLRRFFVAVFFGVLLQLYRAKGF